MPVLDIRAKFQRMPVSATASKVAAKAGSCPTDTRMSPSRPGVRSVLANMAADGAGVALLPEFIVAEHLKTGRLVPVLPGWSSPQFWLMLYYPPYQKLPPRIAAFSDFFEREIPALVTALV